MVNSINGKQIRSNSIPESKLIITTPINPGDIATKSYVDNSVSTISNGTQGSLLYFPSNNSLSGTSNLSWTDFSIGNQLFTSFASGNWNLTSFWTTNGTYLTFNGTSSNNTATLNTLTATVGTTYVITITMNTWSSGFCGYTFGGVAGRILASSATTITDYITATSTSGLIFTAQGYQTTNFTVNNISIQVVNNANLTINNIGNVAGTAGIILNNNTIATSVNPYQNAPSIVMSGNQYVNNGTLGSYPAAVRIRQIGGVNTNYYNGFSFDTYYNGAWNTNVMTVSQANFNVTSYAQNFSGNNINLNAIVNIGAQTNLNIYNGGYFANSSYALNLATTTAASNSNPIIPSVGLSQTGYLWNGTVSKTGTWWMDTYGVSGTSYHTDLVFGWKTTDQPTLQTTILMQGGSNQGLNILGSGNLYFGGTLATTDYSHSLYNSSGDLVFQPRIDAVSAFTFQNASGNTAVLNINTLNPAVVINGNLTVTGNISGSLSNSITGIPGNIVIINSTGTGFIDSGIPLTALLSLF